ncbi:hypothetical protein GCM10010219_65490 [Streptomyces netropsis]|nr:hypothetical protein GCM10010219_65490 [Streptomyces netropsis]
MRFTPPWSVTRSGTCVAAGNDEGASRGGRKGVRVEVLDQAVQDAVRRCLFRRGKHGQRGIVDVWIVACAGLLYLRDARGARSRQTATS